MVDESVVNRGYNAETHERGECSFYADPDPWGVGERCEFSFEQYEYDLGRCRRQSDVREFIDDICVRSQAQCIGRGLGASRVQPQAFHKVLSYRSGNV